jgi:leucyl-tRNA synthetase
MDELRFNTAIAKLIQLTNTLTPLGTASREAIEPLVLMMSPFAPHLAEELWRKLGHDDTLAYADFPVPDPAQLVAESITYPVQVNGKVRGRVEVSPETTEEAVRAAALESVAEVLAGREPRKVIVVAGRLVSVVV